MKREKGEGEYKWVRVRFGLADQKLAQDRARILVKTIFKIGNLNLKTCKRFYLKVEIPWSIYPKFEPEFEQLSVPQTMRALP